MNVLGINSVFHESAAALLVDGTLVAAVEEERFNRIKHGKQAEFDNPHQLPERAIRFCLNYAGLTAGDIGHVAYSFDPKLRRTRYRAEWWDPRLEETFRLRLGQVRGSIEELFGRSLGQRLPRPREVCITRPLSMGLCEASRLQNMYWPPFKWMACPLTKLPVVQR